MTIKLGKEDRIKAQLLYEEMCSGDTLEELAFELVYLRAVLAANSGEIGKINDALGVQDLCQVVPLVKILKDELATLRPIAEALKTAVELRMTLDIHDTLTDALLNDGGNREYHNGDPLAATIRAIQRAAEAVKGHGK